MSKYGSGAFELFLVNGYNYLALINESSSESKESITQQTNPFGTGSEAHTPVNMEKGTLMVGNAFYDATVDALHTAASSAGDHGVSRIVCTGRQGNLVGKPFRGYFGVIDTKYEVLDTNGQLTKANVTYLVTGQIDDGTIVQPLAVKTASWNTKSLGTPVDNAVSGIQRTFDIVSNSIANPSIVTTAKAHGLATGDIVKISGVLTSSPTINGTRTVTVIDATHFSVPVNVTVAGTLGSFVRANTTGGAVGYQQVTAYSGFTGFIGTLKMSPDDITYSSLIAFTNLAAVAGPNVQRIAVAGTVDEFLSFDGALTGAGSITAFSGLARLG